MTFGFGAIVAGIWLFYFRAGAPDTFIASISSAGGWLVSLVFAMFLSLHGKIQDRSLHYHNQLCRLQRLCVAIRLAESHQDNHAQIVARNMVIQELVTESATKNIGR